MLTHRQGERLRRLLVAIMATMLICGGIARLGSAQDSDERRLWDTEFLKKRQPAKTSSTARKPPAYRRTTAKPAAAADDKVAGEMLGVTVWRLRPSDAADHKDSRLLLQDEDKDDNKEWTPERVEAETAFATGERVRLSIESSRAGYLYVIDREQYNDGTTSEPYLIFPTLRIRNGNNAVAAGKVIELPEKTAFRLTPMRPDYKGELLTLIVATEPLAEIVIGPRIQKLEGRQVEQWERQWAAAIERFEMVGGAGKTYTRTEKEAGTEGRLLTQEDELPQTLYRIVPKPGMPLLVAVPLRIGK
ncbi:MAG: hypothetical protein V7641_1369 [Blastocatellia bacterium]